MKVSENNFDYAQKLSKIEILIINPFLTATAKPGF